ncbi:MAG: phosphoesterase [Planctomycetia bacterium]|nr:phosphoesterase [Planctomycetia bacterium]
MSEENILVVPTGLFRQLGYFQGFCDRVADYAGELLAPEHVLFRPRSLMEQNPEFKQLIPYMIFCYTDDQGTVSVFNYVRGKGMGEKRLHSKRSIGIGGHLNDHDAETSQRPGHDVYHEGMFRELREEVILRSPWTQRCVGLINDDLTEVGRVHLGVVHRFDLQTPDMMANEEDLIESGFLPVSELLAMPEDSLESWTAISLAALFRA